MLTWAWITAQTPDSTPSSVLDATSLLQFGFVGFILLCLLVKKFVVPEWALRQSEERIKELENRNRDLQDKLDALTRTNEERLIPALLKANEVAARALARGSRGGG